MVDLVKSIDDEKAFHERLKRREVTVEKLSDGFVITYSEGEQSHQTLYADVFRTIGGKQTECKISVRDATSLAAAIAACKTLAPAKG